MYTVHSQEKIAAVLGSIGTHVKKSELLSGSMQEGYGVAAIVLDHVSPSAEVHDNHADVWIVLNGTALFTLGGELVDKVEKKPGEWVAASIVGGVSREVSVGDVVDIPQGTPHQVSAREGRAEFIILKIQGQSR